MRTKSRCDYYRVLNFGRTPEEDYDLLLPSQEQEEETPRQKRVDRILRLRAVNEEIDRLHRVICVKPKEAFYEIHYGVKVTRSLEEKFVAFMENEHELNSFTIRRVRGLFASTTIRRSFLKKYGGHSGSTQKNISADQQRENDSLWKEEYVNRTGRG